MAKCEMVVCIECGGSGEVDNEICPLCDGAGLVELVDMDVGDDD